MKPFLAAALAFVCLGAAAQTAAPPTQRLRGTVESIDGSTIVLKERNGEAIRMTLADNFGVNEVVPIPISSLQPGTFVGTAALSDAGGKLRALEVLLLPEAARGSGEGHYPWDLEPGSTMTNGTVTEMVVAANGRTLKLRYKDGEQTVVVPDDIPIVTFKPGDRSLIVVGAKVLVTAQMRDGKLVALRALAGRNGFAPPM
jgi:hypothetical protein